MSNWTPVPAGATRELFVPAATKQQDVRFAVGTPDGPRGAVWYVIASRWGDLYIGEPNTMKVLKFSLHESGVRRLAFVKQYAENHLPPNASRVIVEWEMCEWVPGWTHELDIWVPAHEVTTTAPVAGSANSRRKIAWIAPPLPGTAVVFRFVTCRLMEPSRRPISFPAPGPMEMASLWLNRRTGPEACVILALHESFDEEDRDDTSNAAPDVPPADRLPVADFHATDGRSVTFDVSHAVPSLVDRSLMLRAKQRAETIK